MTNIDRSAPREKLRKADFERLNSLIELHKKVSDSPNTLVNLPILRSYPGSLFSPMLAAIVGSID
jgi:hypothetical protein